MADIKIKDVVTKTVKTLDKAKIGMQKTKDNIVSTKEKVDNVNNKDEHINEKASNEIMANVNHGIYATTNAFNKYGKKSFENTKDNIAKANFKIKGYKNKKLAEKSKKVITKGGKTAIKTTQQVGKRTKQVAKETVKNTERAMKFAKETAKATIRATKITVMATIKAIKAIILGTKALITAIVAGGWIAVVVILIVCLVGLLCSSIFGIFFSSEKNGNSITMNSVVADLNKEFATKISNIQKENPHDDYVITSNRAEWKDILSVYSVKVAGGNNTMEVITLNESKVNTLKTIFWDMNSITSSTKEEVVDEEKKDDLGKITIEKIKKKILYIDIKSKTVEEMIIYYNFNLQQKQQLNELLNEKYANLWSSVIFGSSVGSPNIVQIALSQVGNVGGQPYWSWYGFNNRVEWCATFVSWVGNQAGYIEANVIPKFAGVSNGINWFKAVGQWKDKGFIPNPGDIIFFDWESDGISDHVGIVEKVENNKVYTIEGNSNDDMCRQKDYDINHKVIFGYGTPAY